MLFHEEERWPSIGNLLQRHEAVQYTNAFLCYDSNTDELFFRDNQGRGRGRGGGENRRMDNGVCYNCGKFGHHAKDCSSKEEREKGRMETGRRRRSGAMAGQERKGSHHMTNSKSRLCRCTHAHT